MKNLKILHITDFHLRHSSRLYYSTARKLNNGFIRNNFYVNELSERDFEKKLLFFDKNNYNKKIIEIVENLNPIIIVLGHCSRINFKTFEYIKQIHPNIKIAQWYVDSLIPTGPDYSSHLNTFNKYTPFVDCSFVTSDPLSLKFYYKKNKNIFYIPNPSDLSIDNLKIDQITNNIYDIFIALSHGQHRATLKKFYKDEREEFITKLKKKLPDIIFDSYGLDNNQPVWGNLYYERLSQSKMALNLKNFTKYNNFIDCSFLTSNPLSLKFYNKKIKNIFYIPNPSDTSIDNLKVDQISNNIYDMFIALSHGQHRATLKKFYKDEREEFIIKLKKNLPDVIFDTYGVNKNQPIWGDQYYKRLSQSKMALNLSRGLPFKWYSSDRISSFIPNGITTFVDRATKLDDFFSDDEVVFYKNINELRSQIIELKNNDKKRRRIGKKGRIKYNTHFNSTKVAKFIFEKTLNLKLSEKYFWDK